MEVDGHGSDAMEEIIYPANKQYRHLKPRLTK
jgi:hypothetical protein